MKKIIGQLHLWGGLAAGLVVLVVALTGSILVFEKEIDEAVHHDFYFAKLPANASRLPLDSLMTTAKTYDSQIKINRIELSSHEMDRTVIFWGKKGKDVYKLAVDPYTGKAIRSINHTKSFFAVTLQLHRYLLLGEVGKAITGVSCLIFISLIITGIVLWWPKNKKVLKQRLKIKWDASRKRLNWDLHAVGGLYTNLVLFIIAFTGLTWSYKWFNNGIFLLFDGKPAAKFEAPANKVKQPIAAGFYEQVYQQTNLRLPYKGFLSITIPEKDSLAVTVNKETEEASRTNLDDFLYFERGTGTLLKERLYKDESTGMKVRRAIYPIHTGSMYGWPTKIIAFICTLIGASLPITGLCVWLGRKKKKKTTKAKPAVKRISIPASPKEVIAVQTNGV